MRPIEYTQLFQQGESVLIPPHLYGRVMKGRTSEDFHKFTDDPDRDLVMIIGHDGLEKIIGLTTREIILGIVSWEPKYLRRRLEEGYKFKLAVFSDPKTVRLATWDQVLRLVAETYPTVAMKLMIYSAQLKEMSFGLIEETAGFNFSEVSKNGLQDSRFMTLKRFEACPGGLADTRAFLYFSLQLREEFVGDGLTKARNGYSRVKEYIMPNQHLSELGDHVLIDLEID